MFIKQLKVTNFRCFSSTNITFEQPVTIISGDNGTGKTSLLEAIHYMCYMRSFRAASPRDLIKFDTGNFFVKVSFENDISSHNELQVGFSQNKKIVKLNKNGISSFKDLMDHYRVVTLTEDDLWLIKGGPDVRRAFLDQAILLLDYSFLEKMREFKKVLSQRNMLLQEHQISTESYNLWTGQLWEKARSIQVVRAEMVCELEKTINKILTKIFKEKIRVSFEYKTKYMSLDEDFTGFIENIDKIKQQEMRFRRSLFGPHLDDFIIKFQSKKSKVYASRGQQKLVVLLLKVAQMAVLDKKRGAAVLLLDDFMTDFDEKKAALLANFLISLDNQLIFTSPAKSGFFDEMLLKMGARKVELSH